MTTIISVIIGVFVIATLFCGVMAARNLDEGKIGSLSKRSLLLMGPMVPEEALTDSGKRWAIRRNIFAAIGLGGAVLYGIVMRLMGS